MHFNLYHSNMYRTHCRQYSRTILSSGFLLIQKYNPLSRYLHPHHYWLTHRFP
uniref:Uncharacterized protein n=1 Tax=Zea mays TaxID=4577 RepID=B6T1V4_MAIZE|nr:hypothetical protein [Zea mays]